MELLTEIDDETALTLSYDWGLIARDKQLIPNGSWMYWLINAGRGFGKTRTGAETIRLWKEKYPRIHLIAPTAGDVRDTMVEGESGLLSISPPWDMPEYEPSKRRLTWKNGSRAYLFSAEEPNRLRGPQCYAAWADELAAWKYPQETWDMLLFGTRLGEDNKIIITTTPRPIPVIKELINGVKTGETFITTGSTFENRDNLSKKFFDTIIKKYDGTKLGQQEIYAEILDKIEGALWTYDIIERVSEVPVLIKSVVAVDPAVTSKDTSDDTGIVCVGLGADGFIYVFDDLTGIYSPKDTMRVVVSAYDKHESDIVVGETNNGGDYIKEMLRLVGGNIPFASVWASRGKVTRAEPVVLLYEQRRVRHVGSLAALESEMTTWSAKTGEKSPNRIDALVWGITYLTSNEDEDELIGI